MHAFLRAAPLVGAGIGHHGAHARAAFGAG